MSCEIQFARQNHQPTHQQVTKLAGKAWPKMTQNANFRQNLVVLGQKILIFTGESKSFGTHITENLDTLFALVFGRAWDQMGQKCQYLAKKSQFWAKFGCFGAKNPNSYGRKQKFWYPFNGKTT